MSGKKSAKDQQVKKAASLTICFPGLKVPEGRRAAEFSNCKGQNTTIQMQVCRLYKQEFNKFLYQRNHQPLSQNTPPNPKMKQMRKTSIHEKYYKQNVHLHTKQTLSSM